MKLQGQTLDTWFKAAATTNPGDLRVRATEYLNQYENAVAKLEKYVHQDVTKGAIAADGGFLTDHGPDHIRKVILRAGEMLDGTGCELSMYEAYVLLMAIHFHDIGNAYGRKEHESASSRAMTWLGQAAGNDDVEKRLILQIARAHGGEFRGNKDTITPLPKATSLLNLKVRPQLLAALVRFADELADDRERASRFMVETGALPITAKVYHAYAYALHSLHIDREASCVHLEFELTEEVALEKFQRDHADSYLLDYIFERTVKMHTERMYCMRFLREYGLAIDNIEVQIKVHGEPLEPLETIGYRLAETGYPTTAPAAIYDICPDLMRRDGWPDGGKVNGPGLASRLQPHSTQ